MSLSTYKQRVAGIIVIRVHQLMVELGQVVIVDIECCVVVPGLMNQETNVLLVAPGIALAAGTLATINVFELPGRLVLKLFPHYPQVNESRV
jgi:hypothetical protein